MIEIEIKTPIPPTEAQLDKAIRLAEAEGAQLGGGLDEFVLAIPAATPDVVEHVCFLVAQARGVLSVVEAARG
ncbi:MAG: hypothetical protein ACT4QE_17240 [Anaerolineales bacterium]